MLSSGSPRPLILCSVRDILQQRKPSRLAETVALVERYFDAVLVHGDPNLVSLEASFSLLPRLSKPVSYTGYVSESCSSVGGAGRGHVVVAAGGGAVGLALLKTALAARAATRLNQRTWRFLVGSRNDLEALRHLPQADDPGVVIERNRPDYGRLLRNAALSVSQAGYNTVLDLLQARCRVLLVPFEGQGETEQLTRARTLAAKGLAVVRRESGLRPERLARAVNLAAGRRAAVLPGLDTDGANKTARLLATWLDWQPTRGERA
jgi:predicted glycosyltransferase